MRTLLVLLDKEWRLFFRNPFLPKLAVAFPLMVMLVIPWVTTMDVRHINVAVVDADRSPASRRLVQKIAHSDYFTLHTVTEHRTGALDALDEGKADIIVEISDGFGEGKPECIDLTANGVNAVKGSLGMQYMMQTVAQTMVELHGEEGIPAPATELAVVVQNRYNPTLEYRFYMIPALMIMLLVLLCGMLPALNLVGEKETGTIEQMNVTPVGRLTFTLSKLIPYWIIGFVALTIAMIVSRLIYGLAPAGSIGTLYLAAFLFVLAMSGLGVIAANRSETMQQVMFVMFFVIMIMIIMSGLITPIESMPVWAQWLARLLPPSYFVEIMRAVYLKGTALTELGGDFAALAGFALVFGTLAAATYRKRF